MRYDTEIEYFNEKRVKESGYIANVTEFSTEKQMAMFPGIKEEMIIVRIIEPLSIRAGYFGFVDLVTKKKRYYSIQKSQRTMRGSSFYASEHRDSSFEEE